MYREITLPEVLDARERRVLRQQRLLEEYKKPLISFTMNIAGPLKNSALILHGFELGLAALKTYFPAPVTDHIPASDLADGTASAEAPEAASAPKFPCLHREEVREVTGNEACLVVDGDPTEIKRITAAIEDGSALGRLFDIDVIRPDGTQVSRKDLGMPARRCLICGRPAKECGRSRAHSVEELQQKTREILRQV